MNWKNKEQYVAASFEFYLNSMRYQLNNFLSTIYKNKSADFFSQCLSANFFLNFQISLLFTNPKLYITDIKVHIA
jgi:hypothetical protein